MRACCNVQFSALRPMVQLRRAARAGTILVGSALLLAHAAMVYAQSASPLRGGVTRSEVLQLPQFCWSGFIPELNSADFRINASVCPAANHYCEGLLDLTRAKKINRGDRNRETRLRVARAKVVYTLRGTEPYPACPIRPHVKATLLEIDALLGQLTKSAR